MTIKHLTLSAALGFAALAPVSADSNRPLGDSRMIAAFPFPGYPEGIAVRDGRIYASGPAAFGVPGDFSPSKTFVYDVPTGAMVDSITIQGFGARQN